VLPKAADPNNVAANLTKYLKGFSSQARDILDKFRIEAELVKLEERNLLYLIVKKFAAIDLYPESVDNRAMGYTSLPPRSHPPHEVPAAC
jgi:type I restriction enzyme M protein